MKKCVGAAAIALAVVLAVAAFGRARNIGKVIVSQENVDSFLAPLLFQLNSSLTEKKSNNTTSDVSLDENDESAKVKSTQLGRPNTEVKRHHFPMNLVNFLHIGKVRISSLHIRDGSDATTGAELSSKPVSVFFPGWWGYYCRENTTGVETENTSVSPVALHKSKTEKASMDRHFIERSSRTLCIGFLLEDLEALPSGG